MKRHLLTMEQLFAMPTLPDYVEWEDFEEGEAYYDKKDDDYIKLVSRHTINVFDEHVAAPRLANRFYKFKLMNRWHIVDVFRASWKDKYVIARLRIPVVRIKVQYEHTIQK